MGAKKELSIVDQEKLSKYFVGALDTVANLPETVDKQRLALNFISLLQDKPELAKYGADVMAPMVVRCAKDNLDVLNNEVYIYEGYGGKLTYTPSYKGLRKMAVQKSIKPIKDITAKSIYEGDTLDEEYANGQSHLHTLVQLQLQDCTTLCGKSLITLLTKPSQDSVTKLLSKLTKAKPLPLSIMDVVSQLTSWPNPDSPV